MKIQVLSSGTIVLLFLTFISTIQCGLLNISTAVMNASTVIVCGSSIDMYSVFDATVIMTCPHVLIDKNKLRLININSYFDQNDQLVLEFKPRLTSQPKLLIKFDNNSLIPTSNIHRNNTYYFSLSSELTCRFSPLNNQTVCFYYTAPSNFIQIEYYYDEITYPNLLRSRKTRIHTYTFFIIMTTLILISIFVFVIHILWKNRPVAEHQTNSNFMKDTKISESEATTQLADLHNALIENINNN